MRRAVGSVLLISVVVMTLVGCGPKFTGSLPGRDGNGNGPQPAPGQAVIDSATPSFATAGSASFSVTVTGRNFVPSTAVLWDSNVSLQTTYVSSTTLRAIVPATLIGRPGSPDLIPSPMGTFNFGVTFPVMAPSVAGNNSFTVTKVTVAANDMAWDAQTRQIYVSVAGAGGENLHSVTALDPQTGTLGASVSTAAVPGKLAVSSDGLYLFAGLNGTGTVRRYSVPTLQRDLDITLQSGGVPYDAVDLEAAPGNAHLVAIARGDFTKSVPEVGGIALYDDAVARPQTVPGYGPGVTPIDSLVWSAGGESLYGIDAEGGYAISVLGVSGSGVQLQVQIPSGMFHFGNHLHADRGLLYADNGEVVDPVAKTVVGAFPLQAVQNGFLTTPIMVEDGTLNVAYFMGQTFGGVAGGGYLIEAFDLTHLNFLGAIPITGIVGTPVKMIRWGSDGLAILTGETHGPSASDGIYLVKGGFVTSPAP